MIADALKLTVHFGERDRTRRAFLADVLVDVFAEHALVTSSVMRGIAGFGAKHALRTDELLTLSEDLPMVAVAVDRRERIEAAARRIEALSFDGLLTLEPAWLLTAPIVRVDVPATAKLTVYVGRKGRAGPRPAHEAVVEMLHRRGVEGASVLLGVDGTAHGERRRARFFGRNADVPLMVVSVGAGERIAAVLPELNRLLPEPVITLEEVALGPSPPSGGGGEWVKLTAFGSDPTVVRRLRAAGAAGATSLRGVWGYHAGRAPHGDSFWQLRRRVPVVSVAVDTPANAERWLHAVGGPANGSLWTWTTTSAVVLR